MWMHLYHTWAYLDDSARHCANVCTSVAPDLSLVPNSAQGDTLEGALQHPCYGIGQAAHECKGLCQARKRYQVVEVTYAGTQGCWSPGRTKLLTSDSHHKSFGAAGSAWYVSLHKHSQHHKQTQYIASVSLHKHSQRQTNTPHGMISLNQNTPRSKWQLEAQLHCKRTTIIQCNA